MTMRDTYRIAIAAAKGHMDGQAEERNGKLYFMGTVSTEAEKNRIWNAIRTVPTWPKDIVADIRVQPQPATRSLQSSAPAPAAGTKTYTVVAGDTLTKIAERYLGDATQYSRILELNRDQLTNPDKIRPGQVLRIPA
jgi:nucleoid-associated protein YgaU